MLALIALLLLSPGLRAQTTTGAIVGVVTDPSGAVVPSVSITLLNEGTGASRQAITSDDGKYSATLLPVGIYTVSAEASGFKKNVVTGIILQVNQRCAAISSWKRERSPRPCRLCRRCPW